MRTAEDERLRIRETIKKKLDEIEKQLEKHPLPGSQLIGLIQEYNENGWAEALNWMLDEVVKK